MGDSSSSPNPVNNTPTWSGKSLPPVLTMWIDQLTATDLLVVFSSLAEGRYVDVMLTTAHGASAKPPQVVIK